MKGKLVFEILTGATGHTSTLYLHSDDGNALYISEGSLILLCIVYDFFKCRYM